MDVGSDEDSGNEEKDEEGVLSEGEINYQPSDEHDGSPSSPPSPYSPQSVNEQPDYDNQRRTLSVDEKNVDSPSSPPSPYSPQSINVQSIDNEGRILSERENHQQGNNDSPSSPPSPYSPQSINEQSDDNEEQKKNHSDNDSPPSPYSNDDNKNDQSDINRRESDMEISAGSSDEMNKDKYKNDIKRQGSICDSPVSPSSPMKSMRNNQSEDESHLNSDMDISAGSGDEVDNENAQNENRKQDSGSPTSPQSPQSNNEQSGNDMRRNDSTGDYENTNNETIVEDSVKNLGKESDNSDAESEDIIGKKKAVTSAIDESDQEGDKEEVDRDDFGKKKKKKRARITDLSDSDEENQGNAGNLDEEPVKPQSDEEENSREKYVEKYKKKKKKSQATVSDDSDDESSNRKEPFVSDFDLMMQKKKESMRKRKRRNVDIINDSDDLIAEIITQMRQAAEEDRSLNKQKKIAMKKLQLLPLVMSQLKKHDLKMAFLEQGVLNAMADWLTPLPDRSLPNLKVREGMLRLLSDFSGIDSSLLKSSGIGRALMYLYRHPKELKENKERAGKLITEWARPIFNVTTDYHSLTKEEREQRDYDHISVKKKKKEDKKETLQAKDIDFAMSETGEKTVKPGDKGWVPRARVPMPSSKDYVVRPKWNVETEFERASKSKKPLNRFEKHMKTIQEKKRNSKAKRAIEISIEGRNMAI